MLESYKVNVEQETISRKTIQEVLILDSTSLVDYEDLPDLTPYVSGSGTGRMILDFSSGDLEVTITSRDAT